jgi:hypothetical protein
LRLLPLLRAYQGQNLGDEFLAEGDPGELLFRFVENLLNKLGGFTAAKCRK